jgi:hypothetical protein
MEVAMRTTNLRIEIVGQPISDYRITDRDLEFRALDAAGRSFPDQRSKWRRLTANELLLHLRLETVVGSWFVEKIRESEEELQAAAA